MKNILLFISLIFATKMVEDNIPNLHYKNLAAGFEKHIAPFLLTSYLGFLYLAAKISRSKGSTKKLYSIFSFCTCCPYYL